MVVAAVRGRRGAALGVLILVLAAGGCGRRGSLEPPPDPQNPFALGTPHQANSAAGPDDKGKAGVPRRQKNPPIKPPAAPFILDPML